MLVLVLLLGGDTPAPTLTPTRRNAAALTHHPPAQVLFGIPDIRLFWSTDSRFVDQFSDGQIRHFVPFSKYPPCFKDLSFWEPLPEDRPDDEAPFHANDLNELVRECGGDLVERVDSIDEFTHPKTGRTSHCFRVTYRSMERSLTNAEVDDLQLRLREACPERLGVELR